MTTTGTKPIDRTGAKTDPKNDLRVIWKYDRTKILSDHRPQPQPVQEPSSQSQQPTQRRFKLVPRKK